MVEFYLLSAAIIYLLLRSKKVYRVYVLHSDRPVFCPRRRGGDQLFGVFEDAGGDFALHTNSLRYLKESAFCCVVECAICYTLNTLSGTYSNQNSIGCQSKKTFVFSCW